MGGSKGHSGKRKTVVPTTALVPTGDYDLRAELMPHSAAVKESLVGLALDARNEGARLGAVKEFLNRTQGKVPQTIAATGLLGQLLLDLKALAQAKVKIEAGERIEGDWRVLPPVEEKKSPGDMSSDEIRAERMKAKDVRQV